MFEKDVVQEHYLSPNNGDKKILTDFINLPALALIDLLKVSWKLLFSNWL